MTVELNKPLQPTLKDLFEAAIENVLTILNCHTIGTIQSFDETTQKATVKVNFDKIRYLVNVDKPETFHYPLLQDCPVIVLRGGKGSLRLPIKQGDTCFVLFNDRDMSDWVHSGNIMIPASFRKHSMSDAIVIVGLSAFCSPIDDYDPEKTELVHNVVNRLTMGDALVTLKQNTTQINLDTKVEIKNAVSDMKTLINGLIDTITGLITVIEGIQVTGYIPLTPESVAALAAQITLFNTQKVTFATMLK